MGARFPVEPFDPDRLPDANAPSSGVDPVLPAIVRAAVTGADAYRLTRAALRREGPILRLGNRFVPVERYREIAFIALGSAAVSQALAATTGLGSALTQGFVVGPDPLPREVPFRSRTLPTGPSPAAPVAREVLELAQGLSHRDLLVLLLSSGSLGYLLELPPNVAPEAWSAFIESFRAAGGTSREFAQVARVVGVGAVGGRVRRSTSADLACLVIDRGDGAEFAGGGPTREIDPAERGEARAVLERRGLWARLPRPLADAVEHPPASPLLSDDRPPTRPVAVASPADALRECGDAAQAKRWRPVLAELHLAGTPDGAAERLIARTEAILRASPLDVVPDGTRAPKGLATFAATTLEVPDGADERAAIARFLRHASDLLPWRESMVGLFRTSGAAPAAEAPGGWVPARGVPGPSAHPEVRPLRMRPGITDVGLIATVLVPSV